MPGRLGTLFSFETEFSTPIRLGGYSNANKYQAEIAVRTATSLQQIIRPFLLRRRKEEVQDAVNLPAKTEQVLFCVLSPTQRAMYEDIIQSPEVERCIRRNSPAFGPIMALRKLCNHPMLTHETNKSLKAKATQKKQAAVANALTMAQGRRGDTSLPLPPRPAVLSPPSAASSYAPTTPAVHRSLEEGEEEEEEGGGSSSGVSTKVDWTVSGKLLVLGKILPLWKQEGHKVLVFCQMHSMLNLVETMLHDLGMIYLRMDGHTPVQKRQGIIRDFNNIPEIFVLLLTSRTGGVGISLTAANRVILVDPDFNPQTDIQVGVLGCGGVWCGVLLNKKSYCAIFVENEHCHHNFIMIYTHYNIIIYTTTVLVSVSVSLLSRQENELGESVRREKLLFIASSRRAPLKKRSINDKFLKFC